MLYAKIRNFMAEYKSTEPAYQPGLCNKWAKRFKEFAGTIRNPQDKQICNAMAEALKCKPGKRPLIMEYWEHYFRVYANIKDDVPVGVFHKDMDAYRVFRKANFDVTLGLTLASTKRLLPGFGSPYYKHILTPYLEKHSEMWLAYSK